MKRTSIAVFGAIPVFAGAASAQDAREWMVNPAAMTKKTKSERKPPMKAYPNLSTEDLDAIVAYMASLKKK